MYLDLGLRGRSRGLLSGRLLRGQQLGKKRKYQEKGRNRNSEHGGILNEKQRKILTELANGLAKAVTKDLEFKIWRISHWFMA